MIAALQQSLEWITAHPHWALLLLFVISLVDSIFILGMFVPAGVALFAAGALVALGAIDLWQAIVLATGGAVVGDALSFWLGRRYGERLFTARFLNLHPQVLDNGRRFFARYGVYSVILGRFLGPMRALLPALAGASSMRAIAFLPSDIFASTLWAYAFVLPGVVFGASLGLAAEVAGRLVVLILGLLVAVSLAIWVAVMIARLLQNHAEDWIGRLLDWSRRHRRLGNFGTALADPTHPETPVLLALAVMLLSLSGIVLWWLAGSGVRSYPTALDAAVFQSLRELHTPWGIAFAEHVLRLGYWRVYAPLALVTFASLIGLRKPRAAAHWVAALALGALLSLGLYAIPTLSAPYAYFGTAAPLHSGAGDFVLATVIYTFLPVLLATGRPSPARTIMLATSIALVLTIWLAHLYLGTLWFSIGLLSLLVGTLWSALLTLGYRRHRPERLHPATLLPPVVVIFLLSTALALGPAAQMSTPPDTSAARTLTAELWQRSGWRQLPHSRIDVTGRQQQTLPMQWAGSLEQIETRLRDAGWQSSPAVVGGSALRWLSKRSPIADLPVLPQVHAGHHPALDLRLPIDIDHEYLFRIWPSGWHLDDGRPLWVATVMQLAARDMYRLLRYPAADPAQPMANVAMLEPLLATLSPLEVTPRGQVLLISCPPSNANAPTP